MTRKEFRNRYKAYTNPNSFNFSQETVYSQMYKRVNNKWVDTNGTVYDNSLTAASIDVSTFTLEQVGDYFEPELANFIQEVGPNNAVFDFGKDSVKIFSTSVSTFIASVTLLIGDTDSFVKVLHTVDQLGVSDAKSHISVAVDPSKATNRKTFNS